MNHPVPGYATTRLKRWCVLRLISQLINLLNKPACELTNLLQKPPCELLNQIDKHCPPPEQKIFQRSLFERLQAAGRPVVMGRRFVYLIRRNPLVSQRKFLSYGSYSPRLFKKSFVIPVCGEQKIFQRSLFERLQAAGHPVVMLDTQYRMHPAIRQVDYALQYVRDYIVHYNVSGIVLFSAMF